MSRDPQVGKKENNFSKPLRGKVPCLLLSPERKHWWQNTCSLTGVTLTVILAFQGLIHLFKFNEISDLRESPPPQPLLCSKTIWSEDLLYLSPWLAWLIGDTEELQWLQGCGLSSEEIGTSKLGLCCLRESHQWGSAFPWTPPPLFDSPDQGLLRAYLPCVSSPEPIKQGCCCPTSLTGHVLPELAARQTDTSKVCKTCVQIEAISGLWTWTTEDSPVINNGRENIHVLTGDSIMSLTVTPHNSLTLQRKVLENLFRSTSDSECVTLLIVEVVKYCCYVFPGLSNTVAVNW